MADHTHEGREFCQACFDRGMERLVREVREKFVRIRQARQEAGLAPGERLLGLDLPEDS